jgi:hypothetical protein
MSRLAVLNDSIEVLPLAKAKGDATSNNSAFFMLFPYLFMDNVFSYRNHQPLSVFQTIVVS